MEENYDEIVLQESVLNYQECFFCWKINQRNYFIQVGKFFICSSCWKRFSVFVKEWFEHDILK